MKAPTLLRVVDLRIGRRTDGAPWADSAQPSLSWRTKGIPAAWTQASARITVSWLDTDEPDTVTEISGAGSLSVPWPARPLRSRERARITVTATGTDGVESSPATIEVEAPLLSGADWQAQWIALAGVADDQPGQLRHDFTAGAPTRARLYVTALGVYEVELNGRRVGDEVMAPGWTSYHDRIVHQAHDVTDLVTEGANAVGVWLAGGWFTEKYGFFGQEMRGYVGPAQVLLQLELDYADGSRQVITSSADWTARSDGPLVSSGLYAGERFDATRHDPLWSTTDADLDAGSWRPVRVLDTALDQVVPAVSEPVRRVLHLEPVEVLSSASGATVVDFGQNLVGRIRLRVSGPRGTTITLRHAEIMAKGELATHLLRRATSIDEYTLSGDGVEEWEPRFTFHGFRYLQVDGWPGEFDPTAVTAVVCSSDLRRTAWFTCSDPLVDQLHENAVWGMRGNFVSIPTDCPQRDERRGWTGDLQVFVGAATTLHDCDAFLTSWLTDLALEQTRAGGITPIIIPTIRPMESDTAIAAWGDATTVVPWTLYERYGDVDVLRRQYPSMVTWVETELTRADEDGLWTMGYQLGDWLDPKAPANRPNGGRTHPTIVSSAYLFRSLDLVARTADVLGNIEDAAHYRSLAERTRLAFVDTYVTPRGRMVSEGPTTYALAIVFGLVTDPELRRGLGRRLAEIVREDGYRIGTGFVGTPLILDALCETGQQFAAGRLLRQTDAPSWLYPVTVGATTIWERWDALRPDGTIYDDEMVSLNHYAFGAVADWLHRGLAGLSPAAPGYARLRIAPECLPGFTSASSRILTPYGEAAVSWSLDGDRLELTATVPPGTTAEVILPGAPEGAVEQVGPGTHSWTTDAPIPPAAPELSGLETSLADLVDHPDALTAVKATLREHDPGRAAAFEGPVRYERGLTLRNALLFAQPRTMEAVEQALADLASDAH